MAIQTLIRCFRLPDIDVRVTYDDVAMRLAGVETLNTSGRTLTARVNWQNRNFTVDIPQGTRSFALPVALQRAVTMIDGDVGVDGLAVDVSL